MAKNKIITKTKAENRHKRPLITKRRTILLILILLGILGWRLIAARNAGLDTETAKVKRETLTQTVSASGEVAAHEYAELTFKTSGEIKYIHKKEGDFVQKGQVIAQLDSTSLYQSYLAAEANLRAAQAALDLTYDQVQGHENDESFAQRNTRTQAEAAKDVAYRNFVSASENLTNASITAPFTGIITNISDGVTTGTTAGPTTVFTLINPESIYFNAHVNEIDVPLLTNDMRAIVELDAFPEVSIEETITNISYTNITTTTGGTAYEVQIKLPQSYADKFRVGMKGDVDFVVKTVKDILTVPVTAIVEEDGNTFVWKVEDGKTKRMEVAVGTSSVDSYEITNGVNEGEIVVVRPPRGITEKQTVSETD